MPQYQISVPGKGTFRVDSPTELTDLQAWQAVQSQLAAGPEQPQKSTITGELVRGGKQLVSSTRTGLESVVSPEKAALAGVERGQKISEEAGEGPSFAAVRKAYEERGLLPAAGEVLSQIPRALAGQGAQLAAMAGGARLGAMAGAPLGPAGVIGGGILGAGATLLPQFMGANVERQAQEQLERSEPVSIDRTKAYGAAAGQAALEGAGTAFVLGKRVVKGVLGIADDAALATAKAQQELAKAAARSVAASAGRGALRGTAEIPVEVAQAVLERAQAGLDLTSPEALSEYGENAYLAGLVGPTLGGAAGVAERSGARAKQAELAPAPVAPTPEAPVAPPPVAPAGALEFKPEPYIQFPDGTVGKRSEVEAYIKTLPEDQQMAMRAKLLGLAPQEADKEPEPPAKALEYKPEPLIVYPDGSVAKRSEVDAYIQGLPEEEQIPARAKLLGMGEEVTQVTPEMLRKLGIRGRAPIIQRLSGLELTDPKVREELTNFAEQPFASPEVRGNIFGFLNTIKVTPATTVAPPVSEAPPAPPVAPPVEPPAPPIAPPAEPPAPPVEPAPVVEAAAPKVVLPYDVDDSTLLPIPKAFGGLETEGRVFHGGTWTGNIQDKQGVVIDGVPATSFTRNPYEALEYGSVPGGKVVSAKIDNLKIYAGGDKKLDEEYNAGKSIFKQLKQAGYDGIDLRAMRKGGYNEVVVWNTDALQDLQEAQVTDNEDGERGTTLSQDFQPLQTAAPKAEAPAPETPASETQAEPLGTRKEAQAFGKAIGATQSYPGSLIGRVNQPAQKAAKEGNFQGVLSALEKSKNVIVAEIAKRAKSLGTKIVIDDNAEETYTGPSTLMRQMSIDGAKMHLEALNKIREFAPQVDALPDKAELSYAIRGATINAIDGGKSAGRMGLEDIAKMGHSMFAPLPIGEGKLRTKEDFKRLQKAYEDLTAEYGENDLQLTSTGSAQMTGVAGAYDADTDTIRVPEYNSRREDVLAHEIVHAQTVQAIANPTLRQKPIVARLNKLYEHVKKELEVRPGFSNSLRRAPYGIQSIQEFVAEGMGNPAFQFLLTKIKYENTSAWDSFVQTIANLIGVKRDTAFTELLSIYSELTTEQKAAPKAPAVEAPAAEAPTAKPAKAAAIRKQPNTVMGSTMLADVSNRLGGLDLSLLSEFSTKFITKRKDKYGRPMTMWRNPMVKGVGTLFRKGGESDYVLIATMLEEAGYLEPGAVERDYKEAGERAKELIKAALNREEVLTLEQQESQSQADEEANRQAWLEQQEELKAERDKAAREAGLTPYEGDLLTDDDIDLFAPTGPQTDEQYAAGMRGLGFDETEIADAVQKKQERERAQKTAPGRPAEARAVPETGEGTEGLERYTPEEVTRKQEEAEQAAAAEKKAKAAEQERLRKEQQAKEEKARADESAKDFELGKSAEEQMTGMGDLFKRKSLGSAQAQRSNFEQTLRTLLNKFGLKDVGLSIIEGMQDAGSYAQQLIRIADRADNPIRTLRHEAIHALRELGFFTDAQWKSLSKMAKDKWIDQYLKQRNVDGKPLKAGEESRYDAYMREYNGDMEKITEEAVADAFADFDATKPPAGLLQALLKRMKDLFQSIKSALTKVESVDQIFGKVEEGKLKPGEKREGGERKSVGAEAPKFKEDLGSPSWLQEQIDYAKERGRDRWGVPYMGKTTGSFKGDISVPMSVLEKLRGQRGEQQAVREDSLDYIRKNWDEVSKEPPYIEVAYNGEAWISEGNHRIMVAKEKGLDSLPVEIKYFDGGQKVDGPLNPEKLLGTRKSVRDRATANFLRWFGDSKVVNEKGEPLVVYHGSKSDITEFDPSKGAAGNQGMFFTTDIDLANVYGKDGAVYPVYVSIKNPLILQGNERFAPQGIKGKLAKLLFPAKYTKAEREQRIKDMLFDGNAGRIFSKQDVELLRREGYDGVVTMNAYPEGSNLQVIVAFEPTQIKSAIGNNGDYSLTNPDIRKSIGGVSPGQKALETIRSMGMDVPKPDPTKLEKAKDIWKKAKEDPKLTAQSALKAARDFMDKVETWAFSPDAKLNNDFRRAVIKDFKENEGVLGQLLEMSQSQAVHADALSSQFLIDGGLKYNDKVQKWESFESKANFPALSKKLDEIGEKYGLSKEQIERVAHAYLVAKRLPGLIERNKNLDAEIAAEQASIKPDKKKIKDLEDKKVFISEKQLEQIEPGLSLVKDIPELNQVVDMWNEIRKNTIDVMVNSGLWSPEYAQQMWDNMDYVPYFRDDQIENEAGPQEFIRGLQVKSKEFQLKGSEDAVHDVFDNMIRWTQYAINRSVRAHKALQMVDNAKDIQIGDRKMAEKVTEEKRGMNIARVFRDGKQELYDMADPMYVQAFSAIQNVSIPTIKFMAQVSNVLRQSVVLYPLFSVAQVPQDAFAAMFTSGLKTQHALKIPYLAVKEFIKTLNKTSATHNTLKKFGATGVRDFSATVIRDDAEIYAGLKPPRGGWGKTKEVLSHISMAADNAVRQAVYEASMQQGVKQSEAIEKAFDVINFRRKGTSKMLNILGQTVPFFYAYLSAQRVALKVLTGTGISPTDRKEAFQTLATTSAAVATLSLLYAMANGDDEDYMETPANIRDRTLTIPGSGGVRIPLRPDFFLFPKIIAEHTYLMLSDQGYQDGAKFRTSMWDALLSAVASPTPFPTAIKPAIEVAINYDFFQGKPLIGNFEKEKALERQFRDSTSEFAKLLGATGMVSPIAADHMIRGMFGSFGGLFLYGTNQFLHSDPDVPRPELSAGEMLTALPGTSGLLKRPQESALKNDFYTLRDEVEKAVNTFNDIKTRSPQGMEDFLADEKQMARYMLGKPVDQINQRLSKIRRQMTIITNMPESQMSAAEKSDNIRQLREFEREYLKSVDVKALREMAKI